MGFSEKSAQIEGGGLESDKNSRKWVIAGIALRAPLKPIYTTSISNKEEDEEEEEEKCSCRTPTGEEAKVPTRLTCPPAPRKRKASVKCSSNNFAGSREFFTPPDLESVFIRHHVVQRATYPISVRK